MFYVLLVLSCFRFLVRPAVRLLSCRVHSCHGRWPTPVSIPNCLPACLFVYLCVPEKPSN